MAAKIRSDYGIGMAPSYSVQPKRARCGSAVRLDAAAAPEGCFLGSVRGLAALPGNLGCAVRGLNDRWTAWFQLQGEKLKTRTIPVEEATAYAVLRDEDEGQTVFIGHPIVADRPELVLNVALSEDGKKWLLEVHNPTDHAIKSLVTSSSRVMGVHFEELMELPPGTSLARKLEQVR